MPNLILLLTNWYQWRSALNNSCEFRYAAVVASKEECQKINTGLKEIIETYHSLIKRLDPKKRLPIVQDLILHARANQGCACKYKKCLLSYVDIPIRLCGSVGKDFLYHACGHEFESRLNWEFYDFLHHLCLLLSDYRGMAKWFGVQYYQEGCFSSAVKCKKGPQVLTGLTNQTSLVWFPSPLNFS